MAEAEIVKIRKRTKLTELEMIGQEVIVSDSQSFWVRPLSLREMVVLFTEAQEDFIPIYALALDKDKLTAESLAPFLLAAPNLVARFIAIASDEDSEEGRKAAANLPATVQLVALMDTLRLSVPDAKKAQELLSQVTALLSELNKKGSMTEPNAGSTSENLPLPSKTPAIGPTPS